MDQMLYQKIENSTAHRRIRDEISREIISKPELFQDLLNIAFDTNDLNHYKACWILELVLENNIDWVLPYLGKFCQSLQTYSHDGAIRSISKICMFTAKRHLKKSNPQQQFLSENQLQQISEACFDWLISDKKVASKAYAMRTLFEIGKIQDWIHPELKEILSKDFPHHSPAYKAASKDILKNIS